ncbi:Protein CBG26690 [Caenorhabditis briggsae]|uniref:Protein CBG26690 n=1 Tax=Caenorhabditis briggsae TaxID=6238 RepID=B6IE62_CAEBR|nr:Protein CBG26690 [Caenorhabditis briggsae]CAS01126.1 Protein CBG26690 [Caenorhabditis briggsae]
MSSSCCSKKENEHTCGGGQSDTDDESLIVKDEAYNKKLANGTKRAELLKQRKAEKKAKKNNGNPIQSETFAIPRGTTSSSLDGADEVECMIKGLLASTAGKYCSVTQTVTSGSVSQTFHFTRRASGDISTDSDADSDDGEPPVKTSVHERPKLVARRTMQGKMNPEVQEEVDRMFEQLKTSSESSGGIMVRCSGRKIQTRHHQTQTEKFCDEELKKCQLENQELKEQILSNQEKIKRADEVDKTLRDLNKKVVDMEKEKEKETRKLEKGHAHELRRRDKEMETLKGEAADSLEKLRKSHANELKKAEEKTKLVEKEVQNMRDQMKMVQAEMSNFAHVEAWLKTEKMKSLKLEQEVLALKKQKERSSPPAWSNPKAKEDLEEIERLKTEIRRRNENETALDNLNVRLAIEISKLEEQIRSLEKEKAEDQKTIQSQTQELQNLSQKSAQLEESMDNLRMEYRRKEAADKFEFSQFLKKTFFRLKNENSNLTARIRQQDNTINALANQLAGLTTTTPTTVIPPVIKQAPPPQAPPPIRSTWSPLLASSTSSGSQSEWMNSNSTFRKESPPNLNLNLAPSLNLPPNLNSNPFGGFRPMISANSEKNKCFVCLWEIKENHTTMKCEQCQRNVHEMCGMKMAETGAACFGCEQEKMIGMMNLKK